MENVRRSPVARNGKFLILCCTFLCCLAHAADIEVTATVDRNQMSMGDTFTYTITVNSDDTVQVEQPHLPTFDGLNLLNQWTGMEAHAQWVQTSQGQEFKTVRAQVFNYMLQPQRPGPITIGVAEVVVNGQTYRTKIIRLQVSSQTTPTPKAGGRHRQPFPQAPSQDDEDDDLFSQLLQRRGFPGGGGFQAKPVNPNEAFHVIVEVDKTKAYVGEQVTASWYLATTGMIRDLDTLKYPDLKGFWKEDIEIATQLNFKQDIINGIPYKKALLASSALFPLKAGQALIDSYKAKATVIAGGGAFGAFGFGQPYTFTKASQEVKIEVLPLPTEGRPQKFSGAVGQFSPTASVRNTTVPANQPFELKVRFEGRGNAKLIELPALDLPKNLELYDQKNESKFFGNGTSYKEFTLYVIPREVGKAVIPPITLAYFNPQTKRYEQKSTNPITLNVTPGDPNAPNVPPSTLAQNAKSTGMPKAPQMPGLELEWKDAQPARVQTQVWILIFAGITAFLLWHARNEFGWGRKKKNLGAQVKKRFKKIAQLADQQDWRGVGKETTNAVYYLLGEISGQGGANMELDKLWLQAPPSVRRELESPVKKLMAAVEILSFAPDELVGEFKEKSKLKELISQMEKLMMRAVQLSSKIDDAKAAAGNPSKT